MKFDIKKVKTCATAHEVEDGSPCGVKI